MPSSPTAGVPWSFYAPPVYQWFWFAAPPIVPVPPPGTGGGGVPPGGPSGVPVIVLPGGPGDIAFFQAGRSPVFIRPKPVYRPIANWYDFCLRWDRWKNQFLRPLAECSYQWLEECESGLPDTWAYVPPDMMVFNPVKGIPLPAAGAGDITIFSVQVPDGYDGIILAHFHSVQLPSGSQFLEGSGDLAWRLSADGRYLRDMGNMLEQQGQPRFYDPVPGGFYVRTKNTIVYTVSNANVSGTLPATGQIVAGLHGWFFPRG